VPLVLNPWSSTLGLLLPRQPTRLLLLLRRLSWGPSLRLQLLWCAPGLGLLLRLRKLLWVA
jgi:hypothetical protein